MSHLVRPDFIKVLNAVVSSDDRLEGRGNLALLQPLPADALEEGVSLDLFASIRAISCPLGGLPLQEGFQQQARLVAEIGCKNSACPQNPSSSRSLACCIVIPIGLSWGNISRKPRLNACPRSRRETSPPPHHPHPTICTPLWAFPLWAQDSVQARVLWRAQWLR